MVLGIIDSGAHVVQMNTSRNCFQNIQKHMAVATNPHAPFARSLPSSTGSRTGAERRGSATERRWLMDTPNHL